MNGKEWHQTQSEPICSGLAAGAQSNWINVSQNLFHTIFVSPTGIDTNIHIKIEHCPWINDLPGTDYTASFSADPEPIILSKNEVSSFWLNNIRTGFIRINYLYANGGTPTLSGYYFGGR